MKTPVRVLIVEDSEDDVALLVHWLEQGGFAPDYLRVETEADFRHALEAENWDVVLNDFVLPKFSVDRVLEILAEKQLDLPVVVISGVIFMQHAVRLMKLGAHDFIEKSDLSRLAPAIERELREAENRREKRQAEEELRRSDLRFIDFAAASADWFWEMDADLKFTFVSENTEAVTGHPPEWHLGKTRSEVLGQESEPELWAEHLRTLEERHPFRRFEFKRVTKSGEQMWLSISGMPVFADDGAFLGYRGAGSNVTERKLWEQRVLRAQRMEAIGQLTGGVAHDFNNLLAVIIGNAEALEQKIPSNEDVSRGTGAIKKAVNRGASLTYRLLAFARQQPISPIAADVNELNAGLDDMLRRTLGEKINLEFAGAPGLWPALIDAHQFEDALLNLTINARDAMANGGSLRIETSNVTLDEAYANRHEEVSPGDYVMVSVTDTGAGMSPETQEKIFEPFFTTKDVGEGSGLGLSMVYGFIKQSKGHISVRGALGQGTTIDLYLPRSHEANTQQSATDQSREARRGSERILVVEDEPLVREIAVRALQSQGYEVIQVENGAEAIKLLQNGQLFDLLFADIVLPGGMNGVEIAAQARRLQPNIKVVFTTGRAEQSVVHAGQLAARDSVINKPYKLTELLETVGAALAASAG